MCWLCLLVFVYILILGAFIYSDFFFFFFHQKTAYEMRISDWSSDVCSSDLTRGSRPSFPHQRRYRSHHRRVAPVGPRLPVAPQRHVRFCDPRSSARLPVPRARPAGGKAAPLCAPVRRIGGVRVGTQGTAPQSAAAAGSEPDRDRGFPRLRLRPRRQLHRRGGREDARRSLSDARTRQARARTDALVGARFLEAHPRSEEHTSELQSLMRISYAVFCLKKKRQSHSIHIIV